MNDSRADELSSACSDDSGMHERHDLCAPGKKNNRWTNCNHVFRNKTDGKCSLSRSKTTTCPHTDPSFATCTHVHFSIPHRRSLRFEFPGNPTCPAQCHHCPSEPPTMHSHQFNKWTAMPPVYRKQCRADAKHYVIFIRMPIDCDICSSTFWRIVGKSAQLLLEITKVSPSYSLMLL